MCTSHILEGGCAGPRFQCSKRGYLQSIFCNFSHYNKIWYKTEWKLVILFSFQEKCCCSSNFDFYDVSYEPHLFHVTKFLKPWGRPHRWSLWWKNNLEKVCQICCVLQWGSAWSFWCIVFSIRFPTFLVVSFCRLLFVARGFVLVWII